MWRYRERFNVIVIFFQVNITLFYLYDRAAASYLRKRRGGGGGGVRLRLGVRVHGRVLPPAGRAPALQAVHAHRAQRLQS